MIFIDKTNAVGKGMLLQQAGGKDINLFTPYIPG
jgi:hypothetical protein